MRDTVDIEADRDTKGEFGSPDIAQTIFSKIDDCDIFIADVSAVCQYETVDKDGNNKIKYMPNPNVMLELGYATHVVGWDRVICVLNSDYGAPENMPFDIASRRLTPFSLKDGKSKGEVKRYIKGVIQDTVENILENGKRVKAGFSDLRLGCFVDGAVSNLICPIEVSSSVSFVKYKTQILEESLKLVEQIRSNKITEPSELQSKDEVNDEDEKKTSDVTPIIRNDGSILTPVTNSYKLNFFKLQKVCINDEDRGSIIDLCKEYLGIDISEDTEFFNIGNLERKYDLMSSYSYEGTKEEEDKYDSIMMLEYNLHRVQMMDWYDGTTRHNNFIIAETLEAIEDVILFRISNYFLRFSEEYKRQHGGISHFKNDWYEFVEYGTTSELRITLQRSGFSRDASNYIRQNAGEYIIWKNDEPKLKKSIFECNNGSVLHDIEEIRYNVPELFVDE